MTTRLRRLRRAAKLPKTAPLVLACLRFAHDGSIHDHALQAVVGVDHQEKGNRAAASRGVQRQPSIERNETLAPRAPVDAREVPRVTMVARDEVGGGDGHRLGGALAFVGLSSSS